MGISVPKAKTQNTLVDECPCVTTNYQEKYNTLNQINKPQNRLNVNSAQILYHFTQIYSNFFPKFLCCEDNILT